MDCQNCPISIILGSVNYFLLYRKYKTLGAAPLAIVAGVVQVSQEISSPGNIVAATKFPRIYGRPSITERPYFLGNIAASSIFCRSQVHANDHRLSF